MAATIFQEKLDSDVQSAHFISWQLISFVLFLKHRTNQTKHICRLDQAGALASSRN